MRQAFEHVRTQPDNREPAEELLAVLAYSPQVAASRSAREGGKLLSMEDRFDDALASAHGYRPRRRSSERKLTRSILFMSMSCTATRPSGVSPCILPSSPRERCSRHE